MTSPAEALNEAQLIDRVRSNDAAAFAELRRRHQSDAIRNARVVAHDPDEAEQVAAAAFDRLHAELSAGGGPRAAVSPYLRTVIRRGALDAHRTAGDEHEAADPAVVEDLPYATDPLTAVDDRNVIREAYESLPERWQRALWFTEIEGRAPAALVPDLGSAAKAVAALAYRAREGLRQAYLAVHVSVAVSPECQPVVSNLPAYVREALSPEDDVTVAIHLDTCVACRNRRYELLLLVSNLRSLLAPALLGYHAGSPAATRPVAAFGGAAAGMAMAADRARTSAVAAMAAVSQWPRRAVKVAASAAVGVTAVAALAWAASSAFAPTTSADAASNDRDPLTVTFEQTDAQPPAVTLNPLDLLDGIPAESEEDGEPDEAQSSGDAPTAGGDDSSGGSQPLATAETSPAAAADSNNTSGSEPADSSTTRPAGGGAAAGAPGGGSAGNGAGSGGDSPPSSGSDSDPGDQPAPPAGNDGDSDPDEPTEPDQGPDEEEPDEPGLVEKVLCLLLC